MVNYQISHNSLEPLCSYSRTATRTAHAVSRWNVDTYQPHKVITITTLTISSQWGIKAIAVCNCWCVVDACINNCRAFQQQQYTNCFPTQIPLNKTHPTFIWIWWMTLMSARWTLRPTSFPSLSCLSWAWSVTVDRNSRRRWSVSLLHGGSR